MNVFKRLKAHLMYRDAVKKADEAFERTGQRHYVMIGAGKKKNLLIMDRFNFRKLKHKGYITNQAFVSDLERECFYCTPYKNGNGKLNSMAIGVKKRQFINWYCH